MLTPFVFTLSKLSELIKMFRKYLHCSRVKYFVFYRSIKFTKPPNKEKRLNQCKILFGEKKNVNLIIIHEDIIKRGVSTRAFMVPKSCDLFTNKQRKTLIFHQEMLHLHMQASITMNGEKAKKNSRHRCSFPKRVYRLITTGCEQRVG